MQHPKLKMVNPERLSPYANNARTHSPRQIDQIAASIKQFGFNNPILITARTMEIIAGHGRWQAARKLGLKSVPVIELRHLSEDERRAYIIADNRLAELAGWDRDILSIELQHLYEAPSDAFQVEITGFDGAELDALLAGQDDDAGDNENDVPDLPDRAVTVAGDIWQLGPHRLICGDACDPATYDQLMGGETCRVILCDPPYNVSIEGHVSGLGKHRHREFVQASGELSSEEFADFLKRSLANMAAQAVPGAIAFVFMDWRHVFEMETAGREVFSKFMNLAVWNKTNAGMGSFYRSKHELVFIYRCGNAAHINNFGLGEKGRYRTNVWDYPGINAFGAKRDDELALHPTVKNCAMLADAIRDVSRRGDVVLDGFAGSGPTLIAAEKTGRAARLVELDPLYCDVICARFARFTGESAIHVPTGKSFDALAAERLSGDTASPAPRSQEDERTSS